MKNYLLSFFTLFLVISCNKADSDIKHHFKKFILINNLKDYQIEEIVRKKYSSPRKSDSKFSWKKPIKFTICHREENSIRSLSSRLS